MRFTLVAVLAGLCAVALATQTYDEERLRRDYQHHQSDDQEYLKRYKDVLTLFRYVHQPSYYQEHVQIAKEYSIRDNLHLYKDAEAVKQFLYYYEQGMLPQDEVFSIFYEEQLEQAIALFKIFYYAKDFETFYKTACWARYHMNQGMFLYTFSVALVHRFDTYTMPLPAIYEIYPYYFFNTEVIQQAQQYKQMWTSADVQQNEYRIYANYSGWYLNVQPEQSVNYFTEDVGINAYYYYYNLYRPFWMNSEEYGIKSFQRGEEFYYFYQQLVARYYLERLSNSWGEIPTYDYEAEFETGYFPSMIHQNGLPFCQRENWARFDKNFYLHGQSYSMKGQLPFSYTKVMDYERRIRDAIDAGFIITEEGQRINLYEPKGFNTLGNLIEANPHSVNTRYYGHLQIFARHLLGYSFQPLHQYKVAPSALQHFETSLRDPAFWQLYKRIVMYMQKYKQHLPTYTRRELQYDGVKVESVHVDRLDTYFEQYDIDVTNAVYVNQPEFEHNNFEVQARQYRLNHKPFTYKIKVVSEKPTTAVVRVFIGPKYDEYGRFIELDENRLNFVEFDRFKYELASGENVIERNSRQLLFKADRTTYKQLYQYAMTGKKINEEYGVYPQSSYIAFPNRFLLPKGKQGGQTYQFYVMVSPFEAFEQHQYQQAHQEHHREQMRYPVVGLGVEHFDKYPLGYPFDRPIEDESFYVPNAYFHDVVIYHEPLEQYGHRESYDQYRPRHYNQAREQRYRHGYETRYFQQRRQQDQEYRPFETRYNKNMNTRYNQEYELHHGRDYETRFDQPRYQQHQDYKPYETKYNKDLNTKYNQVYNTKYGQDYNTNQYTYGSGFNKYLSTMGIKQYH